MQDEKFDIKFTTMSSIKTGTKFVRNFFEKFEFLIPIALGLLFFRLTLINISWGLPDIWNPDELIERVVFALEGRWVFDQTNFDYPSLPKYVMFWLGKALLNQGFTNDQIVFYARALSAFLGAMVVVFTYWIARLMRLGILPAILAALLLVSNSELAVNARFGHNDVYLTFFVTLTIFAVIRYSNNTNRFWIYLAGLFAGFAASSKYNGATTLLLPLLTFAYVELQKKRIGKDVIFERLLFVCILFVGGYALGTPRSILAMSFYFENLLPALANHPIRGRGPESLIGFRGQWGAIERSIGQPFFLLFLVSVIGLAVYLWRLRTNKKLEAAIRPDHLGILLVVFVVFDLPITISYYYPTRLFLPLYPVIAVACAAFIQVIISQRILGEQKAVRILAVAVLAIVISYSALRVGGAIHMIKNDPRYEATEFLLTLQPGKLEYTLYPPNIPRENFKSATAYPLFVSKFLLDGGTREEIEGFNTGGAGIQERQPDYLVVDTPTVRRFNSALTCENYEEECVFFRSLLAGESVYKLLATFRYESPWYLPEVDHSFLAPTIMVFQRSR